VAIYALQGAPHAGAQVSYTTPPANGDTFTPLQGAGLLITQPSAGGTSITISIPTPTYDGLTGPVRVVTVPANVDYIIPVPDSVYGTAPVAVTYTGTLTSVGVALVRIP